MILRSLRHFLTNVICGCIYDKYTRKKVRVILNSNMSDNIRFIRNNIGGRITKIKTFVGHQARNLIIGVNNQWIFKFPLRRDNSHELAIREKRVVDVFRKVSRINIPAVELIEHKGQIIRKYEWVHGTTLREMPPDDLIAARGVLAPQIAQFLYDIACYDPDELRDLKPSPDAQPGFMYGWCQGDICDNFIFNRDTLELVAFIDWEDCNFCDFSGMVNEKRPHRRIFMQAVADEYTKIYNKKKAKKCREN